MNNLRSKIIKGLSISLMLTVFQLALVLPCFAVDYLCYVDINNGNNENSGDSPEQAKKNLYEALTSWVELLPTSLSSADTITINLKAGTYSTGTLEEFDSPHSIPSLPVPVSAFLIIGDENGGTVLDGAGSYEWKTGLEIASDNVTIKGIEFINFTEGISISTGNNIKILNCRISDCTSVGVNILDSSPLVKANLINACYESIVMKASTSPIAPQIIENEITGGSLAIKVEAENYQVNPIISSNEIHGCMSGISVAVLADGLADISPVIQNNLIYGLMGSSGAYGISLLMNGGVDGKIHGKILYNTIDGGGFCAYGIIINTSQPSVAPANFSPQILFNNITNFSFSGIEKDNSLSNFTIDIRYNNAWGSATNYNNCNERVSCLEVNPFYVNPDEGNFSIGSYSSCVDAIPNADGAAENVNTDFTGMARPKAVNATEVNYDIGAYEYFAIEHIRYVDVNNGKSDNDGLTLANAWKNFDDALNKCAKIRTSADYNMILYMAQGDYSEANGEQALTHIVPVDNIAIKGMSFEGVNIIGGSGWYTGLRIAKNNVTITELTFKNFNNAEIGAGVEIASSDNVKILNCSIKDCSDGIVVSPDMTEISSNPQIMDNRISGFINNGIKINSSVAPASPVIQRNTISTDSDLAETSAIYIQSNNHASPDIAENEITNSSSSGNNSYGIKIDITGGLSSPVIKSNRFSGIVQSINLNLSSSDTYPLTPLIINNLIKDVPFVADTASVAFIVISGNAFPECYHNTIDGGGVGNKGMFFKNVEGTLTPKIKYNLVTNFVSSGIENDSTAPATIEAAALVYNNAYGNTANYLGFTLPASNIEQDPLYATDFSIPADSPCVDRIPPEEDDPANNDIIGTSRLRPSNSTAPENSDIGAYEYPYMNYDFTMPGGTGLASDYRLLTLPLDSFGEEFLTNFEKYYGSYNTSTWRIFAYDTDNASYLEINDTLFAEFAGRGSSFWVISTDDAFTSDVQTFEGNLIKDTEPFVKELHQGWNLIGLPWPKAKANHIVRLGDLTIYDNLGEYSLTSGDQTMTDPHIWSYEPTNSDSLATNGYIKLENPDFLMDIGKGYWLKVNLANVKLKIPPPEIWYQGKTKQISRKYSDAGNDEVPPAPPAADGVYSTKGGNGCFIDSIM